MKRRLLLAAPALTLARPAAADPQPGSVVRFIPAADLDTPDPTLSASPESRDHALLVFDTLFGEDADGNAQPQMLETYAVSDNGLEWRLRLRPGLAFHDYRTVRARDCVASLRRWMARDDWGKALAGAIRELAALDDRTLRLALHYPVPMLPHALGKSAPRLAAILPERLAATDPATPIAEVIGSGPYTYVAADRQPGKRVAYARFAPYIPRVGRAIGLAGAKDAIIERIEWTPMAEAAAREALRSGKANWWHAPPADALPALAADPALRSRILRPHGLVAALRPNHLHPPFDRPAIRRALAAAVDQARFMQALGLPDWHDDIGLFPPPSPWATPVPPARPASAAATRAALAAAGDAGDKLVLLARADHAAELALAKTTSALLDEVGLAHDLVALDSPAHAARLARTEPPAQGGWSLSLAVLPATDQRDPVGHALLRGTGRAAAPGWPSDERIEAMVSNWLLAPDDDWRRRIAAGLAERARDQVPYIPLGLFHAPTAYRATLHGLLDGPPQFWNLRRA